jgi:glycosyltransferase involved in cell wall biosynthesis
VVDDGSDDGTGRLVREAQKQVDGRIVLISHPHRRGKGTAVRDGMLAATGAFRFFTDAGLLYPLEQVPAFLAALESGAEVTDGKRMSLLFLSLCRAHLCKASSPMV